MLGNFPQAFSHVALVNSALNLTHKLEQAEKSSRRRGKRKAKAAKVSVSPADEPAVLPRTAAATPKRDDPSDHPGEKRT
jgi:hypothetical protein